MLEITVGPYTIKHLYEKRKFSFVHTSTDVEAGEVAYPENASATAIAAAVMRELGSLANLEGRTGTDRFEISGEIEWGDDLNRAILEFLGKQQRAA